MPTPKRSKAGPRQQPQRKPGQPATQARRPNQSNQAGQQQQPATPPATTRSIQQSGNARAYPSGGSATQQSGGARSYRDVRSARTTPARSSSPLVRWASNPSTLIPVAGLAVILVTALIWGLIAFSTANRGTGAAPTVGLSTAPTIELPQTTPETTQEVTTPGTATAGASTPAAATPAATAQQKKSYAAPPPMTIDPNKQYIATIDTSMGTIKAELLAKDAPMTVNNFVFLARDGFYNGTTFHRVIKDFMIQGGDPRGNGTGGPGYQFKDEITQQSPKLVKGILAMANSGPNTNGSQFFIITAQATTSLDGHYTPFGRVIEGQDVADKISMVQKDQNDKPVQPVMVNKITIDEK